MLAESEKNGQSLPMLTILADLLKSCEEYGDGDKDNAITIHEIRRRKI